MAQETWEVRPPRKAAMAGLVTTIIIIALVVFIIAVFTSTVSIAGDEAGIVVKKLGGGQLPEGRVIAAEGEKGIQARILGPGWHFFYWPWKYSIRKERLIEIDKGKVGLITAMDGRSLPPDTIYAPEWQEPDKMLDAEYFLTEGNGYKGPQLTVLKPGKYRLNTRLFNVSEVPITNIKIGTVGVVKSNVGDIPDTATEERLVKVGYRGVWETPLGEGEYYLNSNAYEVTLISIRQVKVSYTAEMEKGEKSTTQEMKPITVRSLDGFTFPVDVRVTYRIDRENAPRVVALVGDDDLVLTKLITPSVRAIFRNNAEKVKALEYVQNRSAQEQQSTDMLKSDLEEYGVTVLAVRIGDVGDEETLGTLLKTQTDREIALQEQTTFIEQQKAAEQKKALTRTEQEAEEEKRLATAAYSVKIAEEDKKKMIIEAEAEAEQVRLVAEARAKAYELISEVMGQGNAALLEIMKLVADEQINITPSVMVGGGSDGSMSNALMGTILRDMIQKSDNTEK